MQGFFIIIEPCYLDDAIIKKFNNKNVKATAINLKHGSDS